MSRVRWSRRVPVPSCTQLTDVTRQGTLAEAAGQAQWQVLDGAAGAGTSPVNPRSLQAEGAAGGGAVGWGGC